MSYNLVRLPNIDKTVKDPHHDGFSEWCLFRGDFYIRHKGASKWSKANRIHITEARIKALNSLIERGDNCEYK